jgi:hypothetical protein
VEFDTQVLAVLVLQIHIFGRRQRELREALLVRNKVEVGRQRKGKATDRHPRGFGRSRHVGRCGKKPENVGRKKNPKRFEPREAGELVFRQRG